jgi:hypothetical protein
MVPRPGDELLNRPGKIKEFTGNDQAKKYRNR